MEDIGIKTRDSCEDLIRFNTRAINVFVTMYLKTFISSLVSLVAPNPGLFH